MFNLCWGEKVSKTFRDRVVQICRDFKWTNDHANWLMACMAWETGERFTADVKNAAGSGATGLIQFMPATAKGLGTTTSDLAKMSAEDQLTFVKAYFRPYANKIKELDDLYMAILWPKAVGLPSGTALFVSPSVAYRQNAGLDIDKDGIVTKAECAAKVTEKFIKGYQFTAMVEDV